MTPHDGLREGGGLRPGRAVRGTVSVPTSKSVAQRAIVNAALAHGATRISALTWSGDLRATRGALELLGVRIDDLAPGAVRVQGRPPGPHGGLAAALDEGELPVVDVGESGTGARLILAALAFCGAPGRTVRVRAAGTLRSRASAPLVAALRATGVEVVGQGFDLCVTPLGPPSLVGLTGPGSSQEVSALLTALAAYPGESRLEVEGAIPSRPYVELTRRVLGRFGARVSVARDAAGEAFTVRGPLVAPERPYEVEPDASAAAVALAAGCLSGGEVRVPGLDRSAAQGDVRIVEFLRAFGCEAGAEEGALFASGRPTRGAELDLSGHPDLAPVLAPVAAAAAQAGGGASRLVGLGTLQGKESPRLTVLSELLQRLGWRAECTSDALLVGERTHVAASNLELFDPRGDHRMAFALALFGLFVEDVRVSEPECVAKSWPSFWDDMERAGALRGA